MMSRRGFFAVLAAVVTTPVVTRNLLTSGDATDGESMREVYHRVSTPDRYYRITYKNVPFVFDREWGARLERKRMLCGFRYGRG